jgi:hypothetical protein
MSEWTRLGREKGEQTYSGLLRSERALRQTSIGSVPAGKVSRWVKGGGGDPPGEAA